MTQLTILTLIPSLVKTSLYGGLKWKCFDSSDSNSVALDSAYDSNFLFSQVHKRSYDSAYDSDSDSVASENQPLWRSLPRESRRNGNNMKNSVSLSGELFLLWPTCFLLKPLST